METISLKEHHKFLGLVRELRKSQKAFFKSRNKSNLQKAKDLEKEIDQILDAAEKSQIDIFYK
jgi:hypothetical protein